MNWIIECLLFGACFLLPKSYLRDLQHYWMHSKLLIAIFYCFYKLQYIHFNIDGHFGDFQFCEQLGIMLLYTFLCKSFFEQINRFLPGICLGVEPLAMDISRSLWYFQRVFQCHYNNLHCMQDWLSHILVNTENTCLSF